MNENSDKTDNENSFGPTFKLVSDKQTQRNYLRSKSYCKKRKLSKSPEKSRNASVIETDPGVAISPCLPTESPTRVSPLCQETHSVCSESIVSPEDPNVCLLDHSSIDEREGSEPAEHKSSADRDQCMDFSHSDNNDTVYSPIPEITPSSLPPCRTPTPFDSDIESNYDENADYMDNCTSFKQTCTQPGCDYRPDNMDGYDDNKRLGLRPNGSFLHYYHCDLCGRKFCANCAYIRRRHFNHYKYVRCYTKQGPEKPLNIGDLIKDFKYS